MKYFAIFLIVFLFGCSSPSVQTLENYDELDLKGITYLTVSDTSGLLMKEDQFWDIIKSSRKAANGEYQLQIQSLKSILLEFEPAEIEKFHNTFTALLAGSYTNKLWGASYLINGGCSDDCFEYFREYLIAHGKNKFYSSLKNPDSCAPWIRTEDDDNWEGIRYAAPEAFKQKAGKEMSYSYKPDYKLQGERFDESTLEEKYPELAKRF